MQKYKKYLSESPDTTNIQDTNLETLEETNNTVDELNIESQNIIAIPNLITEPKKNKTRSIVENSTKPKKNQNQH